MEYTDSNLEYHDIVNKIDNINSNSDKRGFIISGLLLLGLVGVVAPAAVIVTNAGAHSSISYLIIVGIVYSIVILSKKWFIAGIGSAIPVLSLFGISYPVATIGQIDIKVMLVDIALVLFAIIALRYRILRQSRLYTVFIVVVSIFSLWALISGIINAFYGYPLNGIAFGIHQLRYPLAVVSVFVIISRFSLRSFLYLLLTCVGLQAIYGIIQSIMGHPFGLPYYGDSISTSISQTYSIAGVTVTTGMFPGGFIGFSRLLLAVLILFFPVATYQTRSGGVKAIPAAVCAVSTPLFVLLSSFSVTGFGAVMIMMGLMFLTFMYVKYINYDMNFTQILVGTSIGVIATLDSVLTILQAGIFKNSEIRIDQYSVSYSLFKSNPLTGIGGRNFSDVVQGNLPPHFAAVEEIHGVHNTYLAYLTELGIIGLLLFLIAITISYWCSIYGFLSKPNDDSVYLGMIGIGIIGFLFYSLLTHNYHQPTVMLPFWLVATAAVANGTEACT